MDLRLALYDLAARHKLDARAADNLEQLAAFERQPANLVWWLPRVIAVLAAALGGLGVIFWIAANWETLGRFGRFALLQGCFLAACLGALLRPAARAPLGLAALLTIGGLFAYFGQTYQTGADPWQLFALWAALSLPLCVSARSDILWTPWALVALSAVSLWLFAQAGHRWRVEPRDFAVHAVAWGMAVALCAALSQPLRRYTGAGDWALRTALMLATIIVVLTALGGLFATDVAHQYWLALFLLSGAAGALSLPRLYDIFGLSALGLGLNILLVGGLARVLFDRHQVDAIPSLLLLGMAAAGLLAVTVKLILRLAHQRGAQGGLA
jgi:uncharacterized membrane protein